MPAPTTTADEATLDAIRKRLFETGDWDRISRLLQAQLVETGFEDDIKDLAKEKARKQASPSLAALVADVTPEAQAMVSAKIREAVVREIEAVLEREVEKV
ncbi:SAGA histone acetylase and TREX-2 complexes component [Cryptotrichosporon argae]